MTVTAFVSQVATRSNSMTPPRAIRLGGPEVRQDGPGSDYKPRRLAIPPGTWGTKPLVLPIGRLLTPSTV